MKFNFGRFHEVGLDVVATRLDPHRRVFVAIGRRIANVKVVAGLDGTSVTSVEHCEHEVTFAIPDDVQNATGGVSDMGVMAHIVLPRIWEKIQEGHTRALELRNVLRNNAGFDLTQDALVHRVAMDGSAQFAALLDKKIEITDLQPNNLVKSDWLDDKCDDMFDEIQKINQLPAFLRREANRLSGTGQLSHVPQTRHGLSLDEELFYILLVTHVAIVGYTAHIVV